MEACNHEKRGKDFHFSKTSNWRRVPHRRDGQLTASVPGGAAQTDLSFWLGIGLQSVERVPHHDFRQ